MKALAERRRDGPGKALVGSLDVRGWSCSDLRSPLVSLGGALTTVWQGYVNHQGMRHARNVSGDAALLIALLSGAVASVTALTRMEQETKL